MSHTSPPRTTRVPATLSDRYEVVRRLGAGGMADVFEARDRRLGRSVAIKLLRTDLADPTARERFHREAMSAASLTHPNIVAVYDVGDVDGTPYIVMELIDGESLAARIAAHGALEPVNAVGVAEQLLAALGAAHAQGLVHRDVKPANVLLGSDGIAKLADFGIAQALAGASSLTQTGQVIGTPRYLSPEQVMGAPASPQSDLYATGLVLYEMLSGGSPFAGDSPAALAAAHQHAVVAPLRSVQPAVSVAVEHAVTRALAKDPADRFASAAAMSDALRAGADTTIADLPAQTAALPVAGHAFATQPTADDEAALPTRTHRSRSRNRGTAVLAILVGLAVAVGALALLGSGGDEPTSAPTPTTSAAAPVATTPPTAPPTTLPPTTLPPQTVGELSALLANDPDGFGPAGRDLLKRLQKIEANPDRGDREASKALDRLQQWVDEGEISPTFAALAAQILAPIADSSDKGPQRGPGEDSSDDLDDD